MDTLIKALEEGDDFRVEPERGHVPDTDRRTQRASAGVEAGGETVLQPLQDPHTPTRTTRTHARPAHSSWGPRLATQRDGGDGRTVWLAAVGGNGA